QAHMFPVVNRRSGHDRLIFKLFRYCISKWMAAGRIAIAVVVIATSAPAQQKFAPAPVPAIEFPVVMQQNVVAGKTPVGTKIRAKLVIATLVKGQVIPEGATLSGEVIESVAKSATVPSRLGVRMDSVQWKNNSFPITVYLSAWYYPVSMSNQDPMSAAVEGPTLPNSRSVPRPGNRTALPGSDADAI